MEKTQFLEMCQFLIIYYYSGDGKKSCFTHHPIRQLEKHIRSILLKWAL